MIDSKTLRGIEDLAMKADRTSWDTPRLVHTPSTEMFMRGMTPGLVLELVARIRELEGRNVPVGWQILGSETRSDICAYSTEEYAREVAASDEAVRPLYANSAPSGEDEAKVREASIKLVGAWESLRGGHSHSTRDVQTWLSSQMAPAVGAVRRALNLSEPERA